jgi:hypothetical protein
VIPNKACFFTRIGTMFSTGLGSKELAATAHVVACLSFFSELAPHLHDVIDKIAWEAGPVLRVTRRECFDLNNALREDMS